jgi:hypothetical protein
MNSTLAASNSTLIHENKALNGLMKEYEGALENLMSSFRVRAQNVHSAELDLIRRYEEQLLDREEEDSKRELEDGIAFSVAIERVSALLRGLVSALEGESVDRETELVRLRKENEGLKILAQLQSLQS